MEPLKKKKNCCEKTTVMLAGGRLRMPEAVVSEPEPSALRWVHTAFKVDPGHGSLHCWARLGGQKSDRKKREMATRSLPGDPG